MLDEQGTERNDRDIRARSFRFSLKILSDLENASKNMGGRIICSQLIRSALSIGANLEEARGSGTRLEFKRFFEIALKSANETSYWLRLLDEGRLLSSDLVRPLQQETDELRRMIAAAVLKLKQPNSSQRPL